MDRRIDPCMSEVFAWDKIPLAHMKMWKNAHAPGKMTPRNAGRRRVWRLHVSALRLVTVGPWLPFHGLGR
jgi:hypothetical protein